jgi:3,4-dihydroxy 2-butanone 4-phosphate synthase/GTP cyclohydrolase II
LTPTTPEREKILRYVLRKFKSHRNKKSPFVTLTFAQSLDGFISISKKKRTPISGYESIILTHQLRSIHDAILVGIGTVLSDDPQLTVRLIKGQNPQPIILDTHLKISPEAKILQNPISPWIITGKKSNKKREKILKDRGAQIVRLPVKNGRITLPPLIEILAKKEIKRIMVEGGSQVISSFIRGELVNLFILTVAPFYMGKGIPALKSNQKINENNLFTLNKLKYSQIGQDLIIYGTPSWRRSS